MSGPLGPLKAASACHTAVAPSIAVSCCLDALPIYAEWNFPFLSIGQVHFCFKGCWVVFSFLFKFSEELLFASSREPDQTPCLAASDLVLHCLPITHKKNARLIWVKFFAPWEIFHAFLSSADFFQNELFRKILSGLPPECQTIRPRSGPTFYRA